MSELRAARPDILDCLANLSSDEVFTPPKIVNAMLDLLPSELWSNPKARFCDPFTKSGIFLREIVKRLDKGLVDVISDKEERINHIFKNQVFGIAITQLTALFSRRTLYCNKDVTSAHSTVKDVFSSNDGNILYHPCKHTWVNGSCKICGASRKTLSESKEVENYAYPFLHDEAIMKQAQELGFDVVIGNPPYQMNVGVLQESYAVPLYNKFVQRAKMLAPRYLIMIIPSRWFAGGRGLDEFRDEMLHDARIRVLHDYPNAADVFNGVEIKGGVCYFLWDRDNKGECDIRTHINNEIVPSRRYLLEDGNDTFIRYSKAIPILRKVRKFGDKSFSLFVSPQTPFGLYSSFKDYTLQKREGAIKVYGNKFIGYINKEIEIEKNRQWIGGWKIFVPKAIGTGDMAVDVIKPLIAEPNSVCTQTYIMYGPFKTKAICDNVVSYVKTRFFHFMVGLKKVTQDAMSKVYQFVPMQDFSKPWTDEELYKKYKLTKDEIEFIESMIRPMNVEESK